MSSTEGPDPGTAEDQAYFRSLEERFLALRGRATLLSAEDWRVAQAWRRSGIPLDLVVAVMESLFARQRERGSKRGISSLRYFRAAVDAAWQERQELEAGGWRLPRDEGPPVAERLAALAAALPESLPEREDLAARIRALTGPVEEIEASLARFEKETLGRLEAGLSAAERRELERRVGRAVAGALAALPAEEVAAARRRLFDQAIRERWQLPLLSLFSPRALGLGAD